MNEAEAGLDRAEALLTRRRLVEAGVAYDEAEALGACADRCDAGRWMVAMLAGNFDAAWRVSDALRARQAPDPHRFWTGEKIEGRRLIVRCLHGLGDTVQMLQYAELLQRLAGSVVFEAPPPLLKLAPCFEGVCEVITWGELAPRDQPAWDVQIEVMELPYLFRTTLRDLPVATRYLRLPVRVEDEIASRMKQSDVVRVGLVWAAGDWNPERSIPLAELDCLLANENVEFWNLQGGSVAAEGETRPMRNARTICGDGLPELAATIDKLDLVITVDTLAAHLAGALGTPVWVLLQHAADWRWMTDREDSPWYPQMRLFRQHGSVGWSPVIEKVRLALLGGLLVERRS